MAEQRKTVDPGEKSKDPEIDRMIEMLHRTVQLPQQVNAEDAVGGVLCVLTRRLPGGEARDLQADLPPRLRQLLRPCLRHRLQTPADFGREGFLQQVAEHFGISAGEAERLSRAVFAVLRETIPRSELDEVARFLPPDLQAFWLGQPSRK